jgi:hypothetical protein
LRVHNNNIRKYAAARVEERNGQSKAQSSRSPAHLPARFVHLNRVAVGLARNDFAIERHLKVFELALRRNRHHEPLEQ